MSRNEPKRTDGNRNQICPLSKSYATRGNALKKLKKELGENFDEVRYIIIAQADGRFSPAVVATQGAVYLYGLAHNGITVIG